MSIFSKFSRAKRAAEKHKNLKAAKEEPKEEPQYKHVPTHAAVDALSGAPSSWQHEDREAIRFQNDKRRSQMLRTPSHLSTATSINTAINRNSSFNSSDTYGTRDSRLEMRRSQVHMGYPGGIDHYTETPGYRNSRSYAKSPLASTPISPAETSCNSSSSSSSQVLELANSYVPPYIQESNPAHVHYIQEPNSPHVHYTPDPNQLNAHYIPDQYQPQMRYLPEPAPAHIRSLPRRHSYHNRFSQGPEAAQPQYLEEPTAFDHLHKGRKRKLGEAPPWDHVPEKPKVYPVVSEKAIDPAPTTKRRSAFGSVFGKRSGAVAAH
ncbi:hypothetical protein MMC26_006661 [Xylographa opegraphella]|nr:hypothetical protein [Xylographa opegraphella]